MGSLARVVGAASALVLAACASRASGPEPRATPQSSRSEPAEPELAAPLRIRGIGLEAPESVLHDAASDRYLISNVAGGALDSDDRAFISRLRPDGSVEALRWIDSAAPGVELHAPKGMALVGDVLYVADIRTVRKFERVSGKPLGAIPIPGASFLHGLTSDGRGTMYASDSGLGPGYRPSGNDAIHRIGSDGALSVVARSSALGAPSGLALLEGNLWVASFGAGELYRLDASGDRVQVEKPPRGSLDGLAVWDGRLFVSSWEGAAIFERTEDGYVERFAGMSSPADLAFDRKRKRLLVTHYNEDALTIQPL